MGDFNGWREPIFLEKCKLRNFYVKYLKGLEPGLEYDFKFVVDGAYCLSNNFPIYESDKGFVNVFKMKSKSKTCQQKQFKASHSTLVSDITNSRMSSRIFEKNSNSGILKNSGQRVEEKKKLTQIKSSIVYEVEESQIERERSIPFFLNQTTPQS